MPLSHPRRFALLASVTVTFLAAASAPTPLYPRYQAEWALSSLDVTVIFGVYAVAVLASLLVFGRLSDHLGRRPVLLASLAVQVLAMAGFALAGGFAGMLVARVVQGLATGAAVAAVGAGLLDIDRARGTVTNSVVVPIGTATGGLVAGLVVSTLPAPGQLIYALLAVIFVLQFASVALMKETIAPQADARTAALASLRPQFSVSAATRAPLLRATPIIVATWAVPGFFGSLGPALMHGVLGLEASLASGLLMFTLAGSAGLSVVLSHRFGPQQLTTLGALSLGVGLPLLTLGLSLPSIALFFIGASIAGLGFGSGFQGALRSVLAHASPHERAGVLSVVFVIAYLAMGAPAMIAGWLVAIDGNLLRTSLEFAALILVLAALALAGVAVRPARTRSTPA